MRNKSHIIWERTKQWCVDHPSQPAQVVMLDGSFEIKWIPKPERDSVPMSKATWVDERFQLDRER